MSTTFKIAGGIVLGCLVLFAGCGGGQETVTVTEPSAMEPEQDSAPSDESDEQAPEDEESGGGDSGDCIELPDVEGEDHQLAQDTMQAAGFYNLTEEDASGQGRALMLDRNWTVVSQQPGAGECVSADRTVILRAEKDFE